MIPVHSRWMFAASGLALASLASSCSTSGDSLHGRIDRSAGGASNASAGTHADASLAAGAGGLGGVLVGGAGLGGGNITVPDASRLDAGDPADAICAGSVSEAHQVPLDLFIMLDRSLSMSTSLAGMIGTRWTAVISAIGSFIQQPEANGIGVGINYFGISTGKPSCLMNSLRCTTDADCIVGCGPCVLNPASGARVCKEVLGDVDLQMCDVANYAKAETAIAPLPANVQPILASLALHEPSSATPTSAALEGTVDFCRQWATSHAGRIVADVFVTDGAPSACDLDPTNIAAIAGSAFSAAPSVRTFVIGVGEEVSSDAGRAPKLLLDGVALAGGTKQAFVVSDADVNRQFLQALNQIRSGALACTYALPDAMGRPADYRKVNVRYTAGASMTPGVIGKVTGAADCANRDGWYYDDDMSPTRILVCDATCQKFSMDTVGRVEIEVGCATIIAPPPR